MQNLSTFVAAMKGLVPFAARAYCSDCFHVPHPMAFRPIEACGSSPIFIFKSMKFVVSSNLLSSHLQTIGRVIVQKNTLPILDCFKFDIHGLELTITASDNDSTMMSHLSLEECDEDICFAINAKVLQDAIKELPEQPLDIFVNTSTLETTICYQNGQYKMMGQDATDYPVFQEAAEENVSLSLPASFVHAGLTRGLIAVADDKLRPHFNSICFDLSDGDLSLAASNGSQLVVSTYKEVGVTDGGGMYLLGARPVTLLKAMLAKQCDEALEMNLNHRTARFTTASFSLFCRLVDAKYPAYKKVIPQDNFNVLTLNRQAFVSVLRRVLVFANPGVVLVKLRLAEGSLHISTQDLDYCKSAEESLLCEYQGNPMSIAFNGTALLDLVQNIDADDVSMLLADASRAGVLKPAVQKEREEVLMLILPSVFND